MPSLVFNLYRQQDLIFTYWKLDQELCLPVVPDDAVIVVPKTIQKRAVGFRHCQEVQVPSRFNFSYL